MFTMTEAYTALLRAPTPFKGGIGCTEYHARRYLELQLTEPQAAALWLEIQADLKARGLGCTVREMKQIDTGSLDTLPRGDVLDALARLLTKGEFGWPANCDGEEHTRKFATAARDGIRERGYAFMPDEPVKPADPAELTYTPEFTGAKKLRVGPARKSREAALTWLAANARFIVTDVAIRCSNGTSETLAARNESAYYQSLKTATTA